MKFLNFSIAISTLLLMVSCYSPDFEEDNETLVETETIEVYSTGHGDSTNTGGHSGQGEIDEEED